MKVILIDGVCNLCNASVNRIIDLDKNNQFHFASLQSNYGKSIADKYQLHEDYMNTFIFLDNEKIFLRSDAALQVLKQLGGIYSLATIFFIVPKFIRDGVYNFVASHRYQWFGKQDSCRIPTAELKSKFLD